MAIYLTLVLDKMALILCHLFLSNSMRNIAVQ